MNIKELKEVISQLPDDMEIILGSYYRNSPHKRNLHPVNRRKGETGAFHDITQAPPTFL